MKNKNYLHLMAKTYDELTGKALRKVNKAMNLIDKHVFNFEGNQEIIDWSQIEDGFMDFEGYDPISKTTVTGGFEYDKRGRVISYAAWAEYDNNVIPTLTYLVNIKGNGFKRHVKAQDKRSEVAANIVSTYQGQWNQAATMLANWLDDLPGANNRMDESTAVYFEGYNTALA